MFAFEHLEFTDRFDKSYRSLSPPVQKQCKKALGFLLSNPDHPALNLRPVLPAKIYWEARINRPNRIVIRPDRDTAHLIDVVDHDEIGKWG